jgi:hypothetical protein
VFGKKFPSLEMWTRHFQTEKIVEMKHPFLISKTWVEITFLTFPNLTWDSAFKIRSSARVLYMPESDNSFSSSRAN